MVLLCNERQRLCRDGPGDVMPCEAMVLWSCAAFGKAVRCNGKARLCEVLRSEVLSMRMTKKELQEILDRNKAVRCRVDFGEIPDDAPELKYHNQPGYLDGYHFDSQAEIKRYCELRLLKLGKVITAFKVHPRYKISRKRVYEADFEVTYPDGHIEVEDVKGFETKEFRLKADLFRERYPEYRLVLIK